MFKRIELWFWTYAWVYLLVLYPSIFGRKRMSHNNGIVATGTVRVVADPRFPPHDFFEPGTEFLCRLRHASASDYDDTVIQVRSASLKFRNSSYESPLDLEMNTGPTSIFWTARTFGDFVRDNKMVDGLCYRDYYKRYAKDGLVAAQGGIRDNPSSFAELYYYTETVQLFTGKDGVERYVKFRFVPFDLGPETGLMDLKEGELWTEVVRPGETLGPNYLKQEYAERLARGAVKYRLQLQLHTPEPDGKDDPEMLNCNKEWDEQEHPFMDVAIVEIDTLLSFDENNRMVFALTNAPASLALIPSASVDDYNSVNHLRARAGAAKRARLFAYRIFGMPKPEPDVRARPA